MLRQIRNSPSIYDFLGFFGLYPIFGGSFGVESDFLVFVGVGILSIYLL